MRNVRSAQMIRAKFISNYIVLLNLKFIERFFNLNDNKVIYIAILIKFSVEYIVDIFLKVTFFLYIISNIAAEVAIKQDHI